MIRHCLVLTSEYHYLIPPFAYLFRKYFGNDPVTVITDIEPDNLPDGFSYMPVPAYSEGIWKWANGFGNGLKSVLRVIDEPIISIFLPDQFLNEPVDRAGINALADYMLNRPKVLRGSLARNHCLDEHGLPIESWQGCDIVSILPSDIHCSFGGGIEVCPSLWNTRLLEDFLEPSWDLWKFEKVGTEKMVRQLIDTPDSRLVTVGTRPGLLGSTHILRHAQPGKVVLTEVNPNDRTAIEQWLPATLTRI